MTRVEYLGANGWWTGHKGLDLKDPVTYAQKVTRDRVPCRVIDTDTGEILWEPTLAACPYCDDPHAGPFDGSCLL